MDSRWILALSIITVMFAGCAGKTGDFETVEAPELRSGYAWTYHAEGTAKGVASLKINGEVIEDDTQEENFGPDLAFVYEILGTEFDINNESIAVGAAVGGPLMEAVLESSMPSPAGKYPVAIRERDLAWLEADLAVVEGCVQGNCKSEARSLSVSDEAWMDPYLKFPLTPGKKWKQEVSNDAGDPGLMGPTMVVTSEAVRKESVKLPNGTIDAILVVHSFHFPAFQENLQSAREQLKQSGMKDASLDVKASVSMLTWYAPAAKAVAKERIVVDVDMRLKFTMDGDKYDMHALAKADVTQLLSGISLVAEPARNEAGILEFFNSAEPVNDPTGAVSVPSGGYVIALDQDVESLNAAAQESVTFTTTAEPALPEGHKIVYTVTGPDGTVAATGTGDSFTLTPGGPGVFAVQARAVDANNILQATDSGSIIANYQLTQDLECGLVTLDHQFCTAIDVPMAYGIQQATFRVDDASSAGMVPTIGTLILDDKKGTTDEATASFGDDGTVEMTLDEFAGRPLGSTWSLYWDPEAEAMSQGTITIDLYYGGDRLVEMEIEPMWVTLLRDVMPEHEAFDMFEHVLMLSS